MIQYRIEMFEESVAEVYGQGRIPVNLIDQRSRLERYNSRWDDFNQEAISKTITIPPFKVRICEKGYIACIFRNESDTMFCVRIIRLPSACSGVAWGEWDLDLDIVPPNATVQGMTLQPELDLLALHVSSEDDR